MGEKGDFNKPNSVTVSLGDSDLRLEKLSADESGPGKIRISRWIQDHPHSRPLDISEQELVNLLQKAVQARVLSREFLKNLQAAFEI